MSEYPKVSILIPTCNRSQFLVEAVESSLRQEYPNFEIVISDNASTDGTFEIVQKYLHDPRVRYYRNEQNLGSGENYRKLLYEYSTGRYGKFLTDDDSLIETDHLIRSIDLILRHDLKIVFTAPYSKYENEVNGKNLSLGLDSLVRRDWWLDNLGKRKFGLTVFPPCASGYIFDILCAKKENAFMGSPFGDYEFAVKCLLTEKYTGYLKDLHYLERRHPSQDGVSSFRNAIRGTLIFDRIYHYGCTFLREPLMKSIQLRGYRFFSQAFLMPNWIRENGNSFRSFRKFMKVLKAFDPELPAYVFMDMNVLAQFALFRSVHYGRLKILAREVRSYYHSFGKKNNEQTEDASHRYHHCQL